MIVMTYIRSKKVKGNTYYYVVEGKLNKKGLVKQKVLLYLVLLLNGKVPITVLKGTGNLCFALN